MSNDAFTRHNIGHLSASTINLFISNPAMCLMKLAGYSSEAGPAAWRGIGADRAISAMIDNKNMSLESAENIANIEFKDCARSAKSAPDEKKLAKEETHMMKCLAVASEFFVPNCREKKLEGIQGKIEVMLGDVPIPFIGYYDLLFDDQVVDIKTKSYAMSKPTYSDCRQVSLYQLATGKEPWLAYITHKELREFRVSDAESWLKQVEKAAFALERLLSFSDDIEECCRCVFPDLDHWMFSGQDRINAEKIWRM